MRNQLQSYTEKSIVDIADLRRILVVHFSTRYTFVKLIANAQAYSALRDGRTWTLLASDDSARTLALFTHLFKGSEILPQAVLLDRLAESLEDFRTAGQPIAQEAPYFLNYWRSKGWVFRTLRPGDSEESYGLTPESTIALRFAGQLLKPRVVATETRLASVMHQVIKLADDTDTDPRNRMSSLYAEQDRIQQEIEALGDGPVQALDDERAIERAQEIINLAEDLLDDFQNVRAAFENLNQDLRTRVLQASGQRGEVLEALFNGVDYIKNSDAGKSFQAFWRLLTDQEQSSDLEEAIEALTDRAFAKKLDSDTRRFLNGLTTRLFTEASSVQDVMHQLGTSLNRFVRNDDPAKIKRISDVLQRATVAALTVKDLVGGRDSIPFQLTQTVPQVRSIAQFQLKDPVAEAPVAEMKTAVSSGMSLSAIQSMVDQSEIDLRTLRANIRDALSKSDQISLAELLTQYPVPQGFGTVVGYITLGTKHGHINSELCVVSWTGGDAKERSAELPAIHFSKDKAHTLK